MDIFEAARQNNLEALEQELETLHPDVVDARGSTPLIIAGYYNHPEAVRLLLEAQANPDAQDAMGNTPLMGACFKGYTEIAQLLLEFGAAVDTTNGNGATALTFAATFNHKALVELLLQHGADPLLKDRFGKNPIDYAMVQENAESYEILVAALHAQKSSNS
ncbi:hypothetical protein BWI97_00465 [Siphonobacter sp. BAB-5405]|uniref:ankyrin repeat domain-containing protein n=1 Tax=Siphonobacter sp. BAB-5405 TaxID=1864825 RepID=UPI000C7FB105|nr:ankyrin repeat domain-containing protein [Siphonobacter sp. BAB-5405]PMD99465.1 hypothetical protein BWI97_00465 [Siphonobacter sp. BAB-5405]